MPTTLRAISAALVAGVLLLPTPTIAAPAARDDTLPSAARGTAPNLTNPRAWPFGNEFPRTSGTGRYADGAWFWTDFIHDDRGAVGVGSPIGESAGAVPFGTYRYVDDAAAGNAADLFRLGIGLTPTASVWRVDLNTLTDPALPGVVFAIDRDSSQDTATPWPGNAGLTAAGVDAGLVVTGDGAWWHDLTTDVATPVPHAVEGTSLVATVPRSVYEPVGSSRVHVAAGLADGTGESLRTLTPEDGAAPGQPNVFNVGFRDYEDEPAANNFWFEQTQATTLAAPQADVSEFGADIDWGRLAAGVTDPEPMPTGWSNRWYVSSIELGPGRVATEQSTADNEPNYLGRVQPYGLYVPTTYDHSTAAPLTWILHSFTINHNQYGATAPRFVEQVCEERGSICVTPLGRGPDGQYRGAAELDVWEVWRDVRSTYVLDTERTVLGGYSMGGFGTYRLAANHPDLFAAVYVIASAAGGTSLNPEASANQDLDRIVNLRHLPYHHAHGVNDQLVPYTTEALPTIEAFDALDQRYVFDTYPTKDHIVWSLEDGWDLSAQWIAGEDRTRISPPAAFTYRWFPDEVDHDLGIGPDGTWWLTAIRAADAATMAEVAAHSGALNGIDAAAVRSTEALVDPNGNPVERRRLDWEITPTRPTGNDAAVTLTNVAAATFDLGGAGLDRTAPSEIVVHGDAPATITLTGTGPGRTVYLDARRVGTTTAAGVVVEVPAERHVIRLDASAADDVASDDLALPTTGSGASWPAALALLAGLMISRHRRHDP